MAIEDAQGRVALFSSYDINKDHEPCFIRGIYFDEGQVQVYEHNCKSEIRDIYVELPQMNNKSQVEVAEFLGASVREEVFEKVYKYALERGVWEGEGKGLRFEVKDLCKEVITESRAPLICYWLPIDCKERREWLTFTITYKETGKGFKLTCVLDAKVGSGYFGTVGRGAYYDMEIDFEEYLKDYADSFKLELQELF